MMSFKDNLQREMDKVGMTQYRLAQISGISQPTIQRALNGSKPQSDTIKKLASALNISSSALIDDVNEEVAAYEGMALALPGDDGSMRQIPEITLRRVPVLTEQDIIERKTAKHAFENAEMVTTDIAVTENAFGWKMNTSELGDLNLPFAIPVMATLIIEPDSKPKHGDWLLLIDKHDFVSVRRLDADGSHMYLHSLRSKHEPVLLDENYIIYGVVVSINLKTR